MKTLVLGVAIAAATLAGTTANAATVINDRATFTALGGGTSYFNDFNSNTGVTNTPFTFGPITATGAIRSHQTGTAGLNGNVNGTGWLQFRLDVPATGTLTSSDALRLLGFDFRGYEGDESEVIRYTTNTGETGTFSLPSTNSAGFVGFRFNTLTTSINFAPTTGGADASTYFGMDNFQTYTALDTTGAVPEPATWAMMLVGFGGIGFAMRRRKSKVTTTVAYA